MLSLAVDLGYVRFTQARMQIAADSAALEGMRQRNAVINNAFASDCLRRASANRVVRWTLDDDAWDESFAASAGSDLQFNRENAAYGDMVSGEFLDNVPLPNGPAEDAAYARADFTPSDYVPPEPPQLPTCPGADELPPTPWPSTGVNTTIRPADNNAFLVRLRRSNELQGFGAQTEPGVATSGPALPYTFGKAALISGDPSSAYSPARDGLTVRATAIAHVRPALRVGMPQTNPAMDGVTPFTVLDTFVSLLPQGPQTRTVTVNPVNGLMCDGTVMTCTAANAPIGRFIDGLAPATRNRWLLVSTVGQALPAAQPLLCTTLRAFTAGQMFDGYGAVYGQMLTSGTNRVIGFIRIRLNPPAACPPAAAPLTADMTPFTVTMFRAASIVAASNATANLSGGLPVPVGVSAAEVSEVLTRNASGSYGPVLVPVLSR